MGRGEAGRGHAGPAWRVLGKSSGGQMSRPGAGFLSLWVEALDPSWGGTWVHPRVLQLQEVLTPSLQPRVIICK